MPYAFCTASTHAKTGVEMEALAGVRRPSGRSGISPKWSSQICSSKASDYWQSQEANLVYGSIQPVYQIGFVKMCPPASQTLKDVTVAIITLEDRAAAGIYEDKATPVARALLERFGATVTATHVIPDEPDELTKQIHLIRENGSARLIIITTGGIRHRAA